MMGSKTETGFSALPHFISRVTRRPAISRQKRKRSPFSQDIKKTVLVEKKPVSIQKKDIIDKRI